jgi:hypothetical protein
MVRTRRFDPRYQSGQALILSVGLLFAGALGLLFMFSAGQVAATKLRLTNAADAAAYSAALWRARVLNYDAYSNRAIIAQEVAIAQAVTLVSWAKYFQTFNQTAGEVLSTAFPPAAPIFAVTDTVAKAAREATEQAAGLEIWLRGASVTGYKEMLATSQEILQRSINTFGLGAVANEVARANDPTFFAFVLPDEQLFDRLTKRYESDQERQRLRQLVVDSLDEFVKGPRGLDMRMLLLPSGCFGQSADLDKWFHWLRKRGGTVMTPDLERWEAADTASLHDWRKRGFIFGTCREVEALAMGWGAAEATDKGLEGFLQADPGNVRRNPMAAAKASAEMTGEGLNGFDTYSGITKVRELDYDQLTNKRFPTSPVAVLARVESADVRTANHLKLGTGRLRLDEQFAGNRLWSLAAADVYFRRPAGEPERTEYASLFNPYWQVRLREPSAAQRAMAETYVR